ncbi:hypothetical protein DICPUDRAFT_74088 [Dictyostelium purpureum]|uniref:Uncharacterized protein n=1 Tax=Dictyostelium purpureum TaxID=5786 RepID=F0Z6V9_DICPU|nr:uncharacterized protein DICPUDRAFT_74088 [Dictyostelium purpureum]EGC40331.1 hypothetical protein DICPUDRAFT_74088 [Dictyostelium purpureum]|eukprot:XP_003283082.1 hypothetical protein DICPUDRAFT_74088 [Dictyostelium purpureum]
MKIITLIFIILSLAKSQIINGPSLEFGVVDSTTIIPNLNLSNLTSSKNFKSYSRYDWSFIRLSIRSNDSQFLGYADIHPRVDEFTTFRVPNTQNLIFNSLSKNSSSSSDNTIITGGQNGVNQWPGWQIWAEILAPKTITTFTTKIVDSPCIVNGTRLNITSCATLANGTEPTTFKETVTTNSTETVLITLPPKNIIDVNSRTFVNFFAIVIQLDKGNIIDAIWDGDRLPQVCKSCDSCIDNQCGSKYDDMQCDVGNGCQLKIMVAWAGQDKNNQPCQSINKIPSNFQKYSATSIKNIGTGLLSDFFYRINDNNNNPNTA